MRKLLSILLAVCLMIAVVPLGTFTFTASAETSGYYTYTVINNKATIIDVDTSISGDITIPSKLGGYSVAIIGKYAFEYCTRLKSVTIPGSVTSIGVSAFYNCTSLKNVYITDIGAWCNIDFEYDSSNPLYYADNLYLNGEIVKDLVIPDGVTTISDFAFNYCTSLKSATIPDSVTSIGDDAFSGCTSLESITIPDSVTSIGGSAFRGCTSLESITIPDSVTSIDYGTFYKCTNLKSITIPDSVTSIDVYAFSYCTSLESITIPDSVTSIVAGAFDDCTSLIDVWYAGSESDKNAISIDSYNDDLTNATWHYNTCSIDDHIYSGICDIKCENCDWVRTVDVAHSFDDNYCDTRCNICGEVRTISHDFKWIIDKQANCGYTGLKHEECSVCHTIRNENTVIDIVGTHQYENNCDKECDVCQKIRDIEHTYSNECDRDCNVCGHFRKAPHKYDNDCDAICNLCYAEREGAGHQYSNTCDIDCNKCGSIRAIEHTFTNDCDSECNVCFETRNVSHIFDNACDKNCNICGFARTTEHIYGDDHICDECGFGDVKIAEIFPDTSNSGWYADAVAYVYSQGIMSGYANGKFGTSDGIQRQDFLVMLARFDGVDLTQYGYDCNMPDVARGSYYEAAVNWGVEKGITTGYESGKFGVGDKITREQLVTFLYRYAKYKNIDVDNVTDTKAKAFPDYNKVTDFAEEPIIWAIDKGVINGKSGYIAPQGNAQRCEIAQIMYNIFKNEIF